MSESSITGVFFILAIVFLIIVGPGYQNFNTADTIVDTLAKSTVDKYEKDIRKAGYIDQKTYMDFLNDLSKTGEVYDIKLTHTSRLVYPSKTNPNDYEIHEIKYGQDIILNTIKDGNTKYTMRYGDDFEIEIDETEPAPSRILSSILSKRKAPLLKFNGGGMVENEVTE